MLGTENDYDYSSLTGYKRHINRHQWNCDELERVLADDSTHHAEVLRRMRELIRLRRAQAAFHPNATQFVLHLGNQIFAFWRQSMDRRQSLFCLNNVSDQNCSINLSDINLIDNEHWRCLISGAEFAQRTGTIELLPYQTCWLSNG